MKTTKIDKSKILEILKSVENKSLNPINGPKENWRIVCSAAKNKDTGFIVSGVRHFDRIMRMQIFGLCNPGREKECVNWEKYITNALIDQSPEHPLKWDKSWINAEFGFLDNYGTFLTREEAWVVARNAKQLLNRAGAKDYYLYSEDVW